VQDPAFSSYHGKKKKKGRNLMALSEAEKTFSYYVKKSRKVGRDRRK
jgi:hypothetical protein